MLIFLELLICAGHQALFLFANAISCNYCPDAVRTFQNGRTDFPTSGKVVLLTELRCQPSSRIASAVRNCLPNCHHLPGPACVQYQPIWGDKGLPPHLNVGLLCWAIPISEPCVGAVLLSILPLLKITAIFPSQVPVLRRLLSKIFHANLSQSISKGNSQTAAGI